MNNNFEKISELLLKEVSLRFYSDETTNDSLEFSDNFAELLEKLFILHIRTWRLEDLINSARSDIEIAELKRKIDFCFKEKRPKIIRVINLMLDNYIKNNKHFSEENVKSYAGFKN